MERFAVIVNLHLNKTLRSLRNDFIKFREEDESVAAPTDTTQRAQGLDGPFCDSALSPLLRGQVYLCHPTVLQAQLRRTSLKRLEEKRNTSFWVRRS